MASYEVEKFSAECEECDWHVDETGDGDAVEREARLHIDAHSGHVVNLFGVATVAIATVSSAADDIDWQEA